MSILNFDRTATGVQGGEARSPETKQTSLCSILVPHGMDKNNKNNQTLGNFSAAVSHPGPCRRGATTKAGGRQRTPSGMRYLLLCYVEATKKALSSE